jgi:WD40 repeat protein
MYVSGDRMITGGKDDFVRLWDISAAPFKQLAACDRVGRWVWGCVLCFQASSKAHVLTPTCCGVCSVYFDDKMVACCARDRSFRVFRRREFESTKMRPREAFHMTAGGALTCMQCSDAFVFLGALDGNVRLLRRTESLQEFDVAASFAAHSLGVFAVLFDDTRLATGSKDGTGAPACFCLRTCSARLACNSRTVSLVVIAVWRWTCCA